jgi:hypothetical protein
MRLRLSKAQAQELEQELSRIVKLDHTDMTDKLLALLLTKLYKKLAIALVDLKASYTMELPDETAIALFIYYQEDTYNPANYRDILLKKICNDIEKKYA